MMQICTAIGCGSGGGGTTCYLNVSSATDGHALLTSSLTFRYQLLTSLLPSVMSKKQVAAESRGIHANSHSTD